ncbi:DNA polymerase III subunit gamma/tau [Gemmatimonas sp.]|jgi:DNA polymerase-3 subunit gamma/tau|uniref:DNA polymerase III subunit gamma/tau n=1 Tax=Gemmatimonas sp. TaxID=1962908 RepID=UPI0022C17B13|nr:DNA polymerase III subunit gamma/tau [Gemmatimonas sp.]MCA2982255.1 DNA polymerase III subunit gamma/tau [Gemmatimonas sp.]MCA2987021.1 DNA polymerase III subunit gamma/tau [Gemmatimonas sp.]MCA2994813.1 DNA polymerase III subunit gamma/tau [Gemmatimonas sp.]MCE2955174.1 DNA polymerase III subunit gamma/tau [Gemmatimonas sp.]MCZ8012579.1 DNA polymerase III subunit gamma/tau [Gemmatimonas sp.]
MSLALARKYRPRNFATVAVQSHVANTLKGAIARGRVAHGYLLCGPRGTGKTTLARVLAMALNCERRGEPELQGEPCGQCASCQRIWSGAASLDVVEIDAASNGGVADARDLRERAMYAPSGDDRYKVYIVDEAHMLSRDAWNALLKVLEEPPPRVVFVFATTESQKVLGTVVSRLQRFDLKRIGATEIRERLAAVLTEEGVRFEDEALGMIARAADGGLRDALSLTDQVLSLGETAEVTADRVTVALGLVPDDEYVALLDLILERRAGDIFAAVQRQADAGVDFVLLLAGLGRTLRALLAMTMGGALPDMSERLRAALQARTGRVSAGDLVRMLHALLEIEPMYRKSGQPQLLLETLLVRFALLDRTVELEEVLKGFGAGGGDDPPPRRVAHDARVASAYAMPPSPPPAVAPALAPAPAFIPPAPSQTATQHAAAAAAAAQQEAAQRAPAATVRRAQGGAPTVEQVKATWPQVTTAVRSSGRGMVAEALQRLVPVAVTADGVVTLSHAAGDDTFAMPVERARADVLAALQAQLPGVHGFTLQPTAPVAPSGAPAPRAAAKRLTAHDVQQQRTEQIAAKDPLLEAAVKALDLELLD